MPDNGLKRERDEDGIEILSPPSASPTAPEGAAAKAAAANSTTNFRNVSACNRCRNRKNRCDQKLPRCTGCEKVGVKCVGFDPVSKRTIPRSYIYYLETRVRKLEERLQANNISFDPPEDDFAISDTIRPGHNVPFPVEDEGFEPQSLRRDPKLKIDPALMAAASEQGTEKLADEIGAPPVQQRVKPTHAASKPGVSFARVVFAAVRSTVLHTPSERGAARSAKQLSKDVAPGSGSTGDSFFGLHTRPSIKPAPFPEMEVGRELAGLYFEHANPQIPILHRGEFTALFDRVYAVEPKERSPRELYMLNIVFAIGSGIIMDSSNLGSPERAEADVEEPSQKRVRMSTRRFQPEEYHASAVVHLEGFLSSPPASEGSSGGLEELQAVLLMAGLALLRPVAPGLWYIIGVAVRLAVDLGLHSEDINDSLDGKEDAVHASAANGIGRKQWARDLRRRLWWCVYSFDRLVSTCVGRPFGVTDQVVTTEFPSLFDDRFITRQGFRRQRDELDLPSYKLVAHHYFRLRLLQSEILQVLQHRQAEQARAQGANRTNSHMHKTLLSPFMDKFATFREWRKDVERRLWEWKGSIPEQADTGVAFTPLFLELNYWQAVIMLYRQSLAVPEQLAGEVDVSTAGGDVQSPSTFQEAREDEEMVFMKVAQAGQTVLKIYRQLHRLKLVNYTFLATHHLFMSGISFLYAIWHSALVRSQLTLDDVDFTVLIATSVLGDLIAACPPAEACRDAFVRMSKATIAMVERTTGFGSASTLSSQPLNAPSAGFFGDKATHSDDARSPTQAFKTAMPQFDMDLRDLFSEEELASRPLAHQARLYDFEHRPLPAPSTLPRPPPHYPTASQSPTLTRTQRPSDPTLPSYTTSPVTTLTPSLSNHTPYSALTQAIPHDPSSDFAFFDTDDVSFLDSAFPVPSDYCSTTGGGGGGGWANDVDMGFATGGTGGWDGGGGGGGGGGGDWDAVDGSGGVGGSSGLGHVDMFGGFFFGGDGGL